MCYQYRVKRRRVLLESGEGIRIVVEFEASDSRLEDEGGLLIGGA